MFWLFQAARKLREHGVLGMNCRNAAYILDHNPRELFPLVDDKLRMQTLCDTIRVATPAIYGILKSYGEARGFRNLLADHEDFVIKPNNGSAGRGIVVFVGRSGDSFIRHNGESMGLEEVKQ